MKPDNYVLYVFIFKIFVLLCGLCSIFLGYKLFTKGIYVTSDIEGEMGKKKLSIRRAAPGIFFSLFGCIIICYTINSGFKVSVNPNDGGLQVEGSPQPNEDFELMVEGSAPPVNDSINDTIQ